MLIVCNGMMRSGSTLQYNLVRSLIEKQGIGVGQGFVSVQSWSEIKEQLLNWSIDNKAHVIKTHDILPFSEEDQFLEENVKFFYVYRDIRDVAISMSRKLNQDIRSLLNLLDKQVEVFEHMQAMKSAYIQKYENLVLDLEGATNEIAYVLNLDVEQLTLQEIADEWKAENVKKTKIKDLKKRTKFARAHQKVLRSAKSNKVAWSLFSLFKHPFKLLNFKYEKLIKAKISDQTNLLHYDHISQDVGIIELWRKRLSDEDINLLTNRYKMWLVKNKYSIKIDRKDEANEQLN